ncbi:extracellular solute-binding protein [Pygmaiobacter massiliensis]|uniref:ABC transporter substrate-binding protein n=1 Tax=Pygmaiobacter massiliensis TaxID=1917873 RepID=UPI002A815219|nr:extracellular solute-binding protein [Pygmaiobacter massiliensis]MDY4783963.1 extracellular solute-binding protein [Pygmaiobacter massiliensis]
MKKFIALALSALMAMSAFAGCGSSASSTPASGSTASSAAAQPVSLTWWAFPTFGTDGAYEQKLIDAFTAKNPEISIELVTIDFTSGPEALTSAIEGGTAPDILFDAPGRIIEYGRAGKLVALDDMFTADFVKDVGSEELLNACKADGTAYMYPLSSAPFYMGLNKEMLEKADALQYVNLEGDRTWTTENFVKMCQALRDAGVAQTPGIVYCGAQGGDQGTRALVNNLYSSTIVGKDGKWNINDNGIKALTLLQDMVKDKSLDAGMSYAAADELQQFQAETCAMTFCWGTSNAKNYKSEDYTAISVPFPSEDGKPALEYLVNGFCVFDNGDTAKAEAAKKFLQFICDDAEWGPQSVKQTGAFPVRTSFGNLYEGDEEMTLLSTWTQYYGTYYNTTPGFATMRTEWWNMLQRIFQGGDVAAEVQTYITNSNKS